MTSHPFDESQIDGATFAGLALELHRARCFATLAQICVDPPRSTDARLKVALKLLGQKCGGAQDEVDPAMVRQRFIESSSFAASANNEDILSHLLLAIAQVESQIPDLLPPPPISEEHGQWAHLPPPPVPQSFTPTTEPKVSAPRPKEVAPEIRREDTTRRPPKTSRVEAPGQHFSFLGQLLKYASKRSRICAKNSRLILSGSLRLQTFSSPRHGPLLRWPNFHPSYERLSHQ